MQDTREYILRKAFEVFMAKGYDSTSMTVLQQELGMSRGAMYRYFTGKDELFREVIERYYFGAIEMVQPKFNDDITVAERIEYTYTHLKNIGRFLDGIRNMEVRFLNYTALAIQAAKRFPDFLARIRKYKKNNVKCWEKAIKNSIEKGEIRADIDIEIMANIFARSLDIDEDSDECRKSFAKNVEPNKRMMGYIYSLIKT